MAGRASLAEVDKYNRLFVIGAKDCSPSDIKEAFRQFGEITDVYIPRSKSPRDDKGIAYVTFSKASEAALAIEKMNGSLMKDHTRPLKVVLANSRSQGNVRDDREDEKMLRLFIMVPTSFTQKDIEDEFTKFGHVESVHLVKDRQTGNSRGLAYVRFGRAYDAAIALENCEPKFKPMFADTPRPRGGNDSQTSQRHVTSMDYDRPRLLEPPAPRRLPMPSPHALAPAVQEALHGYSEVSETVLEASLCPQLNYEQVYRLFDIIPGLDICNYDHATGKACVKYLNPHSAAYARDKLNRFEYPPGYSMSVQFLARSSTGHNLSSSPAVMPPGANTLSNVHSLVASIQQAMSALQQASTVPGAGTRTVPSYSGYPGKRSAMDDDRRSPPPGRKLSRFS